MYSACFVDVVMRMFFIPLNSLLLIITNHIGILKGVGQCTSSYATFGFLLMVDVML